MQKSKILIIDDELPIREVLAASLKDDGHIVFTAHNAESGLKAIEEFKPEIVFLDIWMPGSIDGIEVLKKAKAIFPEVDFVMISGHGTIETAVKATKLGAWDFIEKPLSIDKILLVIKNIIYYQSEKNEKTALLSKLRRSYALIGDSSKMMNLKQLISQVANSQSHVLVTGEVGSGRELVAQNVHYLSAKASRPFVDLNCHNLTDDLFEYELFGFEKGAITGAEHIRRGKAELVASGTLYFDDIADLSKSCQSKLLQLLITKKFKRIGGSEFIQFEGRVIVASRKDLAHEVTEKKFSEELFNVVSGVRIPVPALKDHSEDIPSLIKHFSDMVAKDTGLATKNFSVQAAQLMSQHQWPGNVRELKNFIERVYILTPSDFVDVHDLRFAGLVPGGQADMLDYNTFREARAHFEKDYLVKKISENNGNISRTAEVIGLERSYLHRKIKSFGIEVQKGNEDI